MNISIIVAVSNNGVIGKDNKLLWRLPDDLKRFKQLTMGHPIIMGRKTFESIGRALPGRTNIVITRNPGFSFEGILAVPSLDKALEKAGDLDSSEAFVIGGGEIYRQAQSLVDKLFITEVKTTMGGDTFFEITQPEQWIESERTEHEADDRHKFGFDFVNYVKRTDL